MRKYKMTDSLPADPSIAVVMNHATGESEVGIASKLLWLQEQEPGCIESWSYVNACDDEPPLSPDNMPQEVPDKNAVFESVIKDSGKREDFETGSRRDTNDGKSRPDLISPFLLDRLGRHMALGAKKYGEWNWAKGQPSSRYRESLARHLMAHDKGETDEDHLSAAAFNIMGMIHNQEATKGMVDWPRDWKEGA